MCLEELEAELQAYEISARTGRDARKDLEDQLIYGWYQSRKTISTEKRFLSSYIGKKGIGSGNAYRATCLPPMSEQFT